MTFRGGRDADAVRARRRPLGDRRARRWPSSPPKGRRWTLPLYELALMAAARTRPAAGEPRSSSSRPSPRRCTPSASAPAPPSRACSTAHGVRFAGGRGRGRGRRGRGGAGRRAAAAAPPRSSRCRACAGTRPAGLPHDAEGFVPVDEHGRVAGCDRVFAAGDVTDFPLKQGGLAAQQADAAADAILADRRVPDRPAAVQARAPGRPVHRPRPRVPAGPDARRRAASRSPSRCGGRRARSPAATSRPT